MSRKRLYFLLVPGIVLIIGLLSLSVLQPSADGVTTNILQAVGIVFFLGFSIWVGLHNQNALAGLRLWLYQQQWTLLVSDDVDQTNILLPLRHFSLQSHILSFAAKRETEKNPLLCAVIRFSYVPNVLEKAQGMTVTIVQGTVSRSFPSWFCVQREDTMLHFPGTDFNLDSVEFAKKFRLVAGTKEFAYQVFAPDFMQWYLDQQQHPWIFGEGNTFCLLYENIPQKADFPLLTKQADAVKEFLEDSGAFV